MPTRRRARLPFVMSLLIVTVLAVFLWAAYREVASTLMQSAGTRALRAADQLSALVAQSTEQRARELRRLALSPELAAFLEHGDPTTEAAARQVLARLRSTGDQVVELWDARNRRTLTIASSPAAEQSLPSEGPPPAEALGRLHAHNGVVFSDVAIAIGDPRDGESSGGARGFLVIRRPLQSSSSRETLRGIVGDAAIMQVGNKADAIWSDFVAQVPSPAIDRSRFGVAEYASASDRGIDALVDIRGTPWALWIAFPSRLVLAPARAFLGQMSILAVLFVALTAIVSTFVSRRIHELDERVRQRTLEAERANLAKTEFLSRMSHGLRTPLNAVLGFAQLLTTAPLSASDRDSVAQILNGGRHLLDLINDVMDISRIEAGQLSMSVQTVDVGAAVPGAVDLVQPLAAERGITMDAAPPPATGLAVSADARRFARPSGRRDDRSRHGRGRPRAGERTTPGSGPAGSPPA